MAKFKKLNESEKACWDALEEARVTHLPWRKDYHVDDDTGKRYHGGLCFKLDFEGGQLRADHNFEHLYCKVYREGENGLRNVGCIKPGMQEWEDWFADLSREFSDANP